MDINVNRKHKDSVFSALFGTPENLRELYSAIEGIDIPPDAVIDINTLSDVIFMGKINDLSFTIDNKVVVLIEHQSTINNNVPLRLLMYIARVYEKIIDRKKIYHSKLVKIPIPEFIVLYNGQAPFPDHQELKLSTAYKTIEGLENNSAMPLELTVQIYNINHGCNPEILERSKTLNNYSLFIKKINENNELTLAESVIKTVKYCIENDILKDFLEKHNSEIINMLLTDWNMEDAIAVAREEGMEDGLEKGREDGRENERQTIARNLITEGSTLEFIQKITGLDMETIQELSDILEG